MTQQQQAPEDRLFVPLNTAPYRHFERGRKDMELRGYSPRFNEDTVYEGRAVELRRGYSTGDSIWRTIGDVYVFDGLDELVDEVDHTRIVPGASVREFKQSVWDMMGDYDRYIAFTAETG